eukprot:6455179-Amphidinium_carterae.1
MSLSVSSSGGALGGSTMPCNHWTNLEAILQLRMHTHHCWCVRCVAHWHNAPSCAMDELCGVGLFLGKTSFKLRSAKVGDVLAYYKQDVSCLVGATLTGSKVVRIDPPGQIWIEPCKHEPYQQCWAD